MREKASKGHSKKLEMLWTELAVSVAQTAIFFFLALFSSDFLRDKSALTTYADHKINNTTFPEFWLTLLSVLVVSGALFAVLQATRNNDRVRAISEQVLLEIPRTISIFGSSIFAILLAIGVHLINHPEPTGTTPLGKFFMIGIMFWAVSFVYAVGLKFMLSPPNHPTAADGS